MANMEKWLPVVGFEGAYEVSDHGRVRNSVTGKMKAGGATKSDPRPFLLLWKKNRPKMFRVHTLVLTAFIGPKPAGKEGCHNDGDCTNCNLKNLRWDTHQANIDDKRKHGTSQFGETHPAAKLTQTQVNAIRNDTRLQRVIADEYGVLQNCISRIKSGKRWGHS